jgi:hypothetical protein
MNKTGSDVLWRPISFSMYLNTSCIQTRHGVLNTSEACKWGLVLTNQECIDRGKNIVNTMNKTGRDLLWRQISLSLFLNTSCLQARHKGLNTGETCKWELVLTRRERNDTVKYHQDRDQDRCWHVMKTNYLLVVFNYLLRNRLGMEVSTLARLVN